MIIAIASTTGGGGKTALATNLAAERARSKKVLLIDADTQGTSTIWANVREESGITPLVPCVQLVNRGAALPREIEAIHQEYDDVIIDVGGRASEELRAVFVTADHVYFPIKSSGADVWALAQTEAIFSAARAVTPGVGGTIVINLASTNPPKNEAEELRELFADFPDLEFPGIILRNRVAFDRALNGGLGITEYRPRDGKAIGEFLSLYTHVYNG